MHWLKILKIIATILGAVIGAFAKPLNGIVGLMSKFKNYDKSK